MVKNRDAKKGYKFKVKQTKIAGKLTFHRVNKLHKIMLRLFHFKRNK